MNPVFVKNPLPWHIGPIGTILDAQSRIVAAFLPNDLAKAIVEATNAHFHNESQEVEELHSSATVYVIKDENGVYLRNHKTGDWTQTPKLARKFQRRCDATQCINANNYDASVIKLEVY